MQRFRASLVSVVQNDAKNVLALKTVWIEEDIQTFQILLIEGNSPMGVMLN